MTRATWATWAAYIARWMQVEKEEGASEHGDATITSATSGPLEVWAQPAQIAVPNADRVAAGNSFLLLTHQGRVTGKVHHTVLEVVRYLAACLAAGRVATPLP